MNRLGLPQAYHTLRVLPHPPGPLSEILSSRFLPRLIFSVLVSMGPWKRRSHEAPYQDGLMRPVSPPERKAGCVTAPLQRTLCLPAVFLPWLQHYLHHLGGGGWSLHAGGPRVLGIQVAVQLGLRGEELPTELAGEGIFRLLEVLCGHMVLQRPREAKGG